MATTLSRNSASFSEPLGNLTSGELVFHGGASRLTFDTSAAMPDLFRATFTNRIPTVHTANGRVNIEYPREYWPFSWFGRSQDVPTADITLNASIPWRISIRGGASRLDGNLADLALDRFEVRGGASRMELALGRPRGTSAIVIQGGASRLEVVRPGDVPVRIEVAGGMSRLDLDDQHFRALGGGAGLQSPGYATTDRRYLVEIHGGASRVTVRPEGSAVRHSDQVIYL